MSELLSSSSAQLFFAYRALRDIAADEEITLDYGSQWEEDWQDYLQKRRDFRRFEMTFPLFRRTIDLPEGMMPLDWRNRTCSADDSEVQQTLEALEIVDAELSKIEELM